jgi:hypothetical protein
MIELLVVTNATYDAMAANPAVTAAFPTLFTALQAKKVEIGRRCSRCKQIQAQEVLAPLYQQAGLAIIAMAPDSLRRLKAILGAKKLRLMGGVNSSGIPVRYTL